MPVQLERLCRVSRAITQSDDKWSSEMEETIEQVFSNHEELKTAYQINATQARSTYYQLLPTWRNKR
ncbi:MAG: hypothetical protein LBF04_02405 [Prevotellaceae bacterium]|nr:hypothetical protein [Prevotellaceae bacterium]